MCIEKKINNPIKLIVERIPPPEAIVVSEGKLTLNDLMNQNKAITQLSDIDLDPNYKRPDEEYKALVTKEIKHFLITGKELTIYKESGGTKQFHFFMTNDLKEFVCKKQNAASIKNNWRLPIQQMKGINTGYDSKSAFNKTKGLFAKSKPTLLTFPSQLLLFLCVFGLVIQNDIPFARFWWICG